jgi:hypothetical protein
MNNIGYVKNSLKQNSPIYIVDFLNIFSDFREIKYKKLNINFHEVKHINKEKDTIDFFELFFTHYINYIKISKDSNFIFILKKLTNYDNILYNILERYRYLNIRFIIIESKYDIDILDKNKDDFLCQYIFSYLISTNDNCILISTDKYRDKKNYVTQFINNKCSASIRVIKILNNLIENAVLDLNIEQIICDNILTQNYKRCMIPKHKLKNILFI